MSGELVKTAPADRSSVKPLQFITVSSPPRSGCHMMCLAGCLSLTVCPSASRRHRFACLPLSHPFRSPISLLAPSLVSCLCSLPACLSRFDASLRHAYPSGMFVSSHPLIRYARPPRSASPPRSSCRRAGRHHLASISSCVSPAAPACLLTVLRSARSRVAVADVIASLMRSVATVPPLPRLACAVGCFSRHVCAILCAVAMGTIG